MWSDEPAVDLLSNNSGFETFRNMQMEEKIEMHFKISLVVDKICKG